MWATHYLWFLTSLNQNTLSWPVWPDWAIFCTLGNFLKPLATINLPKSLTFLGNICKGVKIYHFSSEIILRHFLQTFGNFYLVTLVSLHLREAAVVGRPLPLFVPFVLAWRWCCSIFLSSIAKGKRFSSDLIIALDSQSATPYTQFQKVNRLT